MQEKTPVISIVDDDESVREGLTDLVRSMGFIAEAFQRAEDFLKSPLITAFPNDRDRTLALHSGVTCYLVKPFNDDDLHECIRSALGARVAG